MNDTGDVWESHRVNNLCLLKNTLLSFFLFFLSLKESYTTLDDNSSLKSHGVSHKFSVTSMESFHSCDGQGSPRVWPNHIGYYSCPLLMSRSLT